MHTFSNESFSRKIRKINLFFQYITKVLSIITVDILVKLNLVLLLRVIYHLKSTVKYHAYFSIALCMYISDGSVVSFQKTAVAVLASVVVFLKTAVAVLMRLC